MKTLAELQAIRQRTLDMVAMRKEENVSARVIVGMATCGIAAGARPVMLEFIEELKRRNITDVTVGQTGCIGVCRLEPIVEITKDGEKVTYVNMNAEKVARIVTEHLVNGKPVDEFTIGAVDGAGNK
ncbi:MAG: (2Fe-2S) ferredoxin domain-containing protein [Christensenellales bacterium]|jgi:NADP-reducing hydrogenase subunit HndB